MSILPTSRNSGYAFKTQGNSRRIGVLYHAGDVLAGLDLFESACQMASETKTELDWLYLDIPHLIDALIAADEDNKAQKILEDAFSLFAGKLGRQHPKTLYLGAKLLSLYITHRQSDDAISLMSELMNEDLPAEVSSPYAIAKVFADIARRSGAGPSLQVASLYAMAAQASRGQFPRSDSGQSDGSDNEITETADESRAQSSAEEYQEIAVKILSACAEKGMIQSPRSQRWLQSCREFEILRRRDDFQHVVGELEKATKTEKEMRFAWNLATIDECHEAKLRLERFATEYPDLADLGAVHFLAARVWAACYESACRQGLADQASEYLSRCSSSLENCLEKGHLKNAENRSILAEDDCFDLVRERISDFSRYVSPR